MLDLLDKRILHQPHRTKIKLINKKKINNKYHEKNSKIKN